MGIYSDGNVYGVRLVLNNDIVFEETYDHIMRLSELEKVKDVYEPLTAEEKTAMNIWFYTLCSSTLGTDSITCWFPGNKVLLEKLLNGV